MSRHIKAAPLKGKKAEILNSWGIVHKKSGNLKLAKQLFSRVLRKYPCNENALINLSAVLQAEGKYWNAWGILMKALRVAPDSQEVHNNLGTVFKKNRTAAGCCC